MTANTHPNFVQTALLHLLGIAESFWQFILPSVKTDAQALLTQLAPIALAAVTTYATDSGKTGEQKRALAVAQIGSDAKTAGIKAGASLVNLALEFAVQHIAAPQA